MKCSTKNLVFLVVLLFLALPVRAGLVVEPQMLDFGEVREASAPALSAVVRNDGTGTVRVVEVVRTCVCAEPSLPLRVFAPGASSRISFRLAPNVLSGPFMKTFYVRTDVRDRPLIPIMLRGNVIPGWQVVPGKRQEMGGGALSAAWTITPLADSPAFVRSEVAGPPGASFALATNAAVLSATLAVPAGLPVGYHRWTVSLYPGGSNACPLVLHAAREYGEVWKVAPQIVRIPSGHDAPDFSTVVWLRPQGYRAPPQDVDPAAITSVPAWAGLSLVPAGRPAARGIPMRLSVAAGVLRFWTSPKTLHVAIPGHGTAALRLEMIPADGTGCPPSGGEECCDE